MECEDCNTVVDVGDCNPSIVLCAKHSGNGQDTFNCLDGAMVGCSCSEVDLMKATEEAFK
jgi:hypothetical protein